MAEQPLSPEEGFASILERYEKMVYGFALARTGSRADADDVFQEVFLAYFQCGKHFQEEEHRRAWLLRTTLNFSRRVTASPWRRRVVPLSERADAPVQFQTPEQTGLWSALSSLPDGLRVPLYLFYFEELSTRDRAAPLPPPRRGADAPGPGGGVSFARARYSLASLTKLQEQICAQLSVKAVLSSWRPGRGEQPSGPVPHQGRR